MTAVLDETYPPLPGGERMIRNAQREAEIHTLKDLVIKKDLELESLRKELQSIRKELDSQTTRQDSQKRKPTPSSKPQQTAP